MTDTLTYLDRAADAQREAALGILRELIAAGREGEAAVQARVAARALALGGGVETLLYRPADVPMVGEFAGLGAIDAGERASVVARFAGRGGGRSLILFAHPDGEPPGGLERWRHDPFAGAISDGRIYGWAVADDLAGVAAMIGAMQAIQAAGLAPAGDVILASTPSKRHARGVSALLHGGLTADGAVYLHPAESGAGLNEIKAFASGQVEFRIMVTGRPPPTTEPLQTAFAHLAVNAIEKALLLGRALQDLADGRAVRVHHPTLHEAVGRSTNLMLSHIAAGEAGSLARSPLVCSLGAALSFPPPEALDGVCAQIEAAVRAACERDPWLREHPAAIEWVSGVTGAETPSDHPLYRVAAEAIRAVTGEAPHVNPMHTASDVRNPIVQKGIPTIGLGPLCGDLAQNGRDDEWVDVEDYLRTVKAVARLIVEWCDAPPS